MWLLKKFWHADIVNKIYILIILFIVVVASITVITRYKNVSLVEQTNKAEEDVVQDLAEENILEKETIAVANIEAKEVEESKEEEKQENKNYQIKKDEKVVVTIETSKITNKPNSTTPQVTERAQGATQTETKEEMKENTIENSNTNQKQETKEESVVETIKEEYKVNTNMINTMKNFIQNNPSDDMMNYGYEVVVDSSIVELTNQFTYTEQRMRNFLKHRFGTIKIYAMDYYYNGNLVMTECFIL